MNEHKAENLEKELCPEPLASARREGEVEGKALSQESALALLRRVGALLEGHFLLTSGRHSGHFILCSLLFQYPSATQEVACELARHFRGKEIETVLGPAMGGLILAYETARALDVRAVYTEKGDRGMVLRRGFSLSPGEKVLVVEDVITTGGSVRAVLDLCGRAGATIEGIGVVVDRSAGRQRFPVPLKSLVSLDFPSYPPEECPYCSAGLPLTKPKA